MRGNERKLVVIGVGNLLLSDEGVGIHAVNEMKKGRTIPSSVEIIDGGTTGFDLLFELEEADYAIIIDCVEAGAEPGSILRIPAEELFLNAPDQMVSIHDVSLPQVLSIGNKMGKLPATVIYGIQPADYSMGIELSPTVKNSLPRLLRLIEDEIKAFNETTD